MTVKVGFDFDEPLYPWYDLAHAASVAAGLVAADAEPPTKWAPFEHYGCSLDEWVAVLDAEVRKEDGMYAQPFKPGVVDLITRMYRRGYEIHVITARGQFGKNGKRVKELTKRSLLQAGMPYTSLHFARHKTVPALELGLDYFIDDAPHNYDELDEAGINVFMLNERWNRPWDDGRRRVDSVEEFCAMIMDKHPDESKLTQSQRLIVNGEW